MPQWHNIVLKTFVQCLHPTLEELSQWERSMRSQVWRTRPVPLVNDVTRTNEVDWRISGEPRTRNQARCRIHYFRMKMTAAKSFEHFFRIRKLMKAVSAPWEAGKCNNRVGVHGRNSVWSKNPSVFFFFVCLVRTLQKVVSDKLTNKALSDSVEQARQQASLSHYEKSNRCCNFYSAC